MNTNKYELRFAGSGGQGVILASIIIAEAALLNNQEVVQSQSYGPEARGGMCKAEVVINKNCITYPKVKKANFLLALTQKSIDTYAKDTTEDALILVDSSLNVPISLKSSRIVQAPILQTAADVVGNKVTANIVAVGVVNQLLHIVSDEVLQQVVLEHVPAKMADLNIRALHEGEQLAQTFYFRRNEL